MNQKQAADMQPTEPGIFQGLGATAKRDLLLAWKRPGDVLNPLFFFAIVSLVLTAWESGSRFSVRSVPWSRL